MENTNPIIVVQENKKIKEVSPFLIPLAAISIYSMIIPILILDIWVTIYQFIYFSILGIPKVNRREYVIMDRYNLSKLTFLQKLNCLYCEYVNGFLAYAKAIAAQTEIYSCAIKHTVQPKGQDHESGFYDRKDFE